MIRRWFRAFYQWLCPHLPFETDTGFICLNCDKEF